MSDKKKELDFTIEKMPEDGNFPIGSHVYHTEDPDELLFVISDKINPTDEDFIIPSSMKKLVALLVTVLFF